MRATDGGARPWRRAAAAEARLRLTELLADDGRLDLAEAVRTLEGLAATWRGDDTELKALRLLADLQVRRRDYRGAFETLKAATRIAPDSSIVRRLQDEM